MFSEQGRSLLSSSRKFSFIVRPTRAPPLATQDRCIRHLHPTKVFLGNTR